MRSLLIKSTKPFVFCIFILFQLNSFSQAQTLKGSNEKWFPEYNFNINDFKNPSQEFGPFARWWWPGNNVDTDELKREINVFADHAFGGVEIQAFSINVPLKDEDTRNKVQSWDTPEFYSNVRSVLEEARRRNIIVDMNNGSGWPVGGSFVAQKDGFISLYHSILPVAGGKNIAISLPRIDNETAVPSRLEAVLAVKSTGETSTGGTIKLVSNSTRVLTNRVKNDSLFWETPEGNWQIIAFWSRPQSNNGSMTASPMQGPIVNLFDSLKVFQYNEYLFGARTGFEAYYGNPLRAVFNDSYEFTVDRHFSDDFLQTFKANRGYDITPWLPANMQEKYNYVDFKNPDNPPAFSYNDEDWRLKYDYDLTLSELLGINFIKASSNWFEKRGMLHRTQAYGMRLDYIKSAGLASIPETESMLGSESNLKLMTSGAHLYNRPVVTAESAVFQRRGYMTTPQKLKIAVDKLFAAGVNQVIFHGVPYRYITPETTPLGWYPFYFPFIDFSAHLGEGTRFWEYQKEVNEYISRVQYALRSGQPHTDVLIYYPFLNAGMPDNPEEILTKGFVEGAEPPLPPNNSTEKSEVEIWAEKIYPFINQLEAHGITWEWVNDASIQAAQLDLKKQIIIRGNSYQAIILAETPLINLETAKKLNQLAKDGLKLLAFGNLPSKQPSFLNWEVNDKNTTEQITEAIQQGNSLHICDLSKISNWIVTLLQPVQFTDDYNFTRQIQREMKDGSRIQFVWNKSNNWEPIRLSLDEKFKYAYWLNAETGIINKVNDLTNAEYVLPPLGSVILFASTQNPVDENKVTHSEPTVYNSEKVLQIEKWDLSVDSLSLKETELFNWTSHEKLKYSSAKGTYSATFHLDDLNKKQNYFIDLGKVYFTAEVVINNQSLGNRIFAPYSFDISDFLQKGENTIEIIITPGQLNGLIGEAINGNPRYSIFSGKETNVMSGGLVGPVKLFRKR